LGTSVPYLPYFRTTIRGFRPECYLLLKFGWAVLENVHRAEWLVPVAASSMWNHSNLT